MAELVKMEQVLENMQASENSLFDENNKGLSEVVLAQGPLNDKYAWVVWHPEDDRDKDLIASSSIVLDAVDQRYGHVRGMNNGLRVRDYIQALRLGYAPTRGGEWTFITPDKKLMSLEVYVPHIPARTKDDSMNFGLRVPGPTKEEMLKIIQSMGGQH